MIDTAVLCPHPPLLFRELGGRQDPVADLRAAASSALTAGLARARAVVVVGGADATGPVDPGRVADVRRFGTTGGAPPRPGLPTSLGVGTRLLHDAGWTGPVDLVGVAWQADRPAVDVLAADLAARPDGTLLLVLGDGSARRGATAPGYLDDRSFPFDDAVARALSDGDAPALRDLDVALAEELLVHGAASLRVLGALGVHQGPPRSAALTYRADPYGVSYLVATWSFRRDA